MQNLTAHFNILYNAGELYKSSSAAVEEQAEDDYEQLLTLYKEPTENASRSQLRMLDSILLKTNAIISEKAKSNYVDDAWLLTAKANYMKSDFYNAVEFFDYVYKTYPDEKDHRQQSLAWKARALIRLNDLPAAADVLDTALKYIATSKKWIADIYATEAQFNIKSGNLPNAADALKKALRVGSKKKNEIRWTYVLAQLEEKNGNLKEAAAHYSALVKSNTSFEMAFNATLNRIRLKEEADKQKLSKLDQLRKLLKQDKNKDFKDQIYYRIADIYLEEGKMDLAVQHYNLALKAVTLNQKQKGITYLKLAELNFKDADYIKAKAYYDSTLMALPPDYPSYDAVSTKASNLDFLADRYKEIALQDTLLTLVKLPEGKRELRIELLAREQVKKNGVKPGTAGLPIARIDVLGKNGQTGGKYYFNNTLALSQGFSDFKKRWGNRKLEDNWRRGSGADVLASGSSDPDALASADPGTAAAEAELVRMYKDNLPLTPIQVEQSNQKLLTAYFEIAGFYKDELKDNEEAIKTYLLILKRFPQNSLSPAIYYNLYRVYSSNPAKAAEYRGLLIAQFPESIYAKVLLDPDYAKKADERTFALNRVYTDTYNAYLTRNYQEVLNLSSQGQNQFGKSNFSSQFAYLSALATGRTQKLDVFEDSLKSLVKTFPDDKLITPLVKQHLVFINTQRELLAKRQFALLDSDGTETLFVEEPKPEPVKAVVRPVLSSIIKPDPVPVNPAGSIYAPPAKVDEPIVQVLVSETRPVTDSKSPELFSLPDAAEYYFVVNVNDARVNLNPSRFGIGQFNRSNYPAGKIVHQLKDVNKENQLVLVGKFNTFNDVKLYEQHILPLMRDIMKIPAEKYNTFVITKEELDKMASRNMLNTYIDFYRRH